MSERLISVLIENALPLAAGGFAIIYGFRIVGPAPGADPALDAWHCRWGRPLRWLGVVLVLAAVLRIAFQLSRLD